MSKLTVANLFRSVRALNDSQGMSPRSAHLIGEKLWRLAADVDLAHPQLELSELLSAVRYVFEPSQKGGAQSEGDFDAWRLQQAERQLRFDPEHLSPTGKQSSRDRWVPEPAGQALRKCLGAVQARERLGGRQWVVIVVDAQASSAELPAEFVQSLPELKRVLVLWCDEQPSAEKPSESRPAPASAFERLSGSPDLVWLGPIAGLEMDGMVAVLEALKALEKPAVLHLRLRSSANSPKDAPADPALGREFDASRGDDGNGRTAGSAVVSAPRPRTTLAVAAGRFSCRAAADPRVMGVNLLSEESEQKVGLSLTEFGFDRQAPVADSIDWCAGLTDGGCRPFLLLDDATLHRLWGPLVEMICDAERAATLLLAPPSQERSTSPFVVDIVDQLRLLPKVAVLVPRDAAELDRMLAAAAAHEGPAAICLPPFLADVPAAELSEQADFGKAATLKEGKDAALFAIGNGAALAVEAAMQLARRGVEASVIDLRYARPLDEGAIQQALESAPLAMLVTDGLEFHGFDAIVSELMARRGLTNRMIAPCPTDRPLLSDPCDRRVRRVQEIVDRCLELLPPLPTLPPALEPDKAAVAATPDFAVFPPGGRMTSEERKQIHAVQLSPTISGWVDEYSRLGSRGLYLWKWCRHGLVLTTLPCVLPSLHDDVCDTKLLSILLCVLLDDVADQHGKRQFLELLLDPAARGRASELKDLSQRERDYAELTWRIWEDYFTRVRRYPRYETLGELLRYDLLQFCNTMRYSHLMNERLWLLNLAEHDLYSSHNMMMVSFATLDLMCSPDFPLYEIGRLREAMWHAQCMGRIGNLLSTWRREIADRDFTSGVFARAVMEGDVTVEQLLQGKPEQIEAAILDGRHEEFFIRRWHEHRKCFENRIRQIRSIDLSRVLDGHERFLGMHVGSEGMI